MQDSKNHTEATLACRLKTSEQQEREHEVRPLLARVRGLEPVANGYRLDFGAGGDPDDPNTAALIRGLGGFVAQERSCCPFVEFALAVERDGGRVTLTVRASEPAQAVMDQFAAFVREAAAC